MYKTHLLAKLTLLMLLCTSSLKGFGQTYCIPTYDYQFSCPYNFANIYSFSLSGIDGSDLFHVPDCGNYTNYTTTVPALQMAAGRTFYGSIGIAGSGTDHGIWIDYDDNGTFSSSEKVSGGRSPNYIYTVFANTFFYQLFNVAATVPANAPTGVHRMRIRSSYNFSTPYPGDTPPCGSRYAGSSADYLVNITAPNTCAPVFTTQPVNPAACGAAVSFTAATDSSAMLQWQVNDGTGFTNITDNGTYSGSATGTLTITTPTGSMAGYQYRCVATNGTCSSVSKYAVYWNKTPVLASPLPDRDVPATGSFNWAAPLVPGTGVTNTWQWQVDDGTGFVNIPTDYHYATTSTTLTVYDVPQSHNNYRYRVIVSNATCAMTSNAATLTVQPVPQPQYHYTERAVTNNLIPFGSANMYRTQLLYLPGDFESKTTGGYINRVYFKAGVATATATTFTNLKVDVGNTTTTSLSSYQTGLTNALTAASYTVQPVALDNWFAIDLATPVYVDMSRPIVVEVSTTARTGGALSLRTDGRPFDPAYTGLTQIFNVVGSASVISRRYSYQFGFDMVNCDIALGNQPGNITIGTDAGMCSASNVQLGTPTAASNCGTVTVSNNAPAVFPTGVTTVTWTATSPYDTVSFDQVVTVVDSIAPAITCPANINVTAATGNCGVVVNYATPTVTDNCGAVPVLTSGPASGSTFPVGNTAVVYTATDDAGNTASCSFTVTVQPAPGNSVSIDVIPANNTYTGGIPTNIYLGYGPQSATLTANATGGTGFTYLWSPATALSCTSCQSPVFTPTAAGNYTYTVTATNSNGCTTTATVTFCVKDIRSSNNKVNICHNGNTLSVSVNAVSAHLANHGDQLGTCGSSCGSANKGSHDDEGHAEELVNDQMKIYPNPTNGTFTVELPAGMDNADVTMVDMTGKLVARRTNVSGTVRFEQSNIAKGVYMIYVKHGNETSGAKLTIY